jgi:hypothetical protein
VISVAEAQSRRGREVVALDKAVRQSAIEFRVHEADVDIYINRKAKALSRSPAIDADY